MKVHLIIHLLFPIVVGALVYEPNFATAIVCLAFIAGILVNRYLDAKEQYKEFAKEMVDLKERVNAVLISKTAKPDFGGKKLF